MGSAGASQITFGEVKMGCMYMIESPSGKQYIGITSKNIQARWRMHKTHALRSADGALQKAIQKYGHENMAVKVLVIADSYAYLKELEVKAIAAFNTKVPNGYNMTDGGDGVLGVIVTDEGRKRRSSAQLKSFADAARKERHRVSQNSSELKETRSKLQSEKMADIERREKIAKAMAKRWKDPDFIAKMAARKTRPKLQDGLSASDRYRLKDIEAYREKKREYAKTEAQKAKRTEYMRSYRAKQRAKKLNNET